MTRHTLFFVEPSRTPGGAARMLLTVLASVDPGRARSLVACHAGSPMADLLRAAGHATCPMDLPALTFAGGPLAMARMALRYARATWRLWRLIRAHRARLVFANGLGATLLAGPAASAARIPLVWHVHDILPSRPRNAALTRAAGAFATAVVCVSEAARRRNLEFGVPARKCSVVYNALPEAVPSPHPAASTAAIDIPGPFVLAAGTVAPLKGHHVLIAAARDIVEHHPGVIIAIAGEPADEGGRVYAERLRADVRRLGLQPSVRFLGFRHDVEALIGRAVVVVHPSTEEEAFGLVPLEAMAAGRPVVASRLGGIPEVVEDGVSGILIEPGHSDELARAVSILLEDGSARGRMGAAGRRAVAERFTRARMVDGLNGVLESVIGGPLLRTAARPDLDLR